MLGLQRNKSTATGLMRLFKIQSHFELHPDLERPNIAVYHPGLLLQLSHNLPVLKEHP